MGYFSLKEDLRFSISDPSGSAVIYKKSDRSDQSITVSTDSTYTVIGYDENNFNSIKIMDSDGNIYYTDYDQFAPESDDADAKFWSECHRRNNEQQELMQEKIQTTYQSGSASTSGTSGNIVYDEDGDEIVGPYKTSGPVGVDIQTSALVKAYGMPPQWTKYVDPRVYAFELAFKNGGVKNGKCALGRRFLDVTISRPTIIEIAPGRVYYPTEGLGSKGDYADTLNAFKTAYDNNDISDIVNDDRASFFTIKPCYTDSSDGKIHGYISYVSILMRVFASFLSRNVTGTDKVTHYYYKSALNLRDVDTDRCVTDGMGEVTENIQFSNRHVPHFHAMYREFTWHQYDGEGEYSAGITENFSITDSNGQYGSLTVLDNGLTQDGFTYIRFFGLNGTRSSDTFDTQVDDLQMASTVNGITTGGVRDAAFFISGVMGDKFASDLDDAELKLKEFANGNGSGGMLSALLDATAEIVRGGKVVFPKVISDCDYGKSMSIECLFPAVYGDAESIYLNAYAGLAHILAMALPHQVKSSIEIYTYPFLVKAFCKGIFSCSMGVISGMNIEYAGESGDMWSLDSVPSEIKVSFQITPLITKLVMSSENDSAGWLLRNNGLQEYIATIAGSDLRSDKIELATELAGIMLQGQPAKMEANAYDRIKDWFFTSTLGRMYSNIVNAWNDPNFTVRDAIDNIL